MAGISDSRSGPRFQVHDWVLFHGWSPETKSRVTIFLERIEQGLAIIWMCLQVRGGTSLILQETCHNDGSHSEFRLGWFLGH